MTRGKSTTSSASVHVENVGGIEEMTVDLDPGVTVLSGENATNRTSLLQSIATVLGSDVASLKGDAEAGRIELTVDDETYERTFERTGDEVRLAGEGYLADPTGADLFAFLLGDNESRRAVERGLDLRELLMRPVDLDALEREISELESRKAEINDELATIQSRKRELPDLEAERSSVTEQIDEKRSDLADLEREIDAASQTLEQSRESERQLQDRLDELRETRGELERVRRDTETKTEAIASLQDERADLESELGSLPPVSEGQLSDLDARIDDLRERKRVLDGEVSDLQSVIRFNEGLLDNGQADPIPTSLTDGSGAVEGGDSVADAPEASGRDGADSTEPTPTASLVADDRDSVTCWTCGTTVDRSQIERTLASLRERRQRIVGEMSDLEDALEDCTSRRRELERERDRRTEIERSIEEIDDEIERREEAVASLRERRSALAADVESLESTVEDLEAADFDELLDLHREANRIEFELERLEAERQAVSEEIGEIEARVREAERLREERERIVEELTELRTRVDRIEADAVEAFNDHMDTVLDVLEYGNIERIWIERRERDVRQGQRVVARRTFELHVVRRTDGGTTYEDTVEHLSESEREVTGLVFALAGYLVHDVHERVPFVLLDSLEAIDSDRIARLVSYFANYAEFLVVALLPEDAQALDDEYDRVTEF